MPLNNSGDLKKILSSAKSILLVDWPSPDIPKALLKAGFEVFTYSPGCYSKAALSDQLVDGSKKETVIFNLIDNVPGHADIVNIFRPEEEHEDIIIKHALGLEVKVIWLQPPIVSEKTKKLAEKYHLTFIQNADIADVAMSIE